MAAVGPEGLPASVALADALIAGLAHRAAPDAGVARVGTRSGLNCGPQGAGLI